MKLEETQVGQGCAVQGVAERPPANLCPPAGALSEEVSAPASLPRSQFPGHGLERSSQPRAEKMVSVRAEPRGYTGSRLLGYW